jgi:predicted nuclease with RNAse H fold
MLSVGIDLAADRAKTAVATIDWLPGAAAVRELVLGADDDLLVAAIERADKAGIDCPLGWPDKFVDFVAAHQADSAVVPEDLAAKEWRHSLAYRITDDVVRDIAGVGPLSVAADRIGLTAMRCASLLARLASDGERVQRAGSGTLVEVYPAASLRLWGLRHREYKRAKGIEALRALAADLLKAAPWLSLGTYSDLCHTSDDAFDALIAALTARAAAIGSVISPTPSQLDAATREGWIALPTCSLTALRP